MIGHQTLGPLFADAEKNVTIMVSQTRSASSYYYNLSVLLLSVYKDPQKQTNKQTNKVSNQTNVPNAHFYSTLLRTAVGNRRFRILIDLNMQKYKDAKSKIEKSLIVMTIVDAVREGSVTGGFVRMVRLLWSR
jgi:hypothetical protein